MQQHQQSIRQIEPMSCAIRCPCSRGRYHYLRTFHPWTDWWLLGKQDADKVLFARRKVHAAQPAQGEERSLARASRLVKEADPI